MNFKRFFLQILPLILGMVLSACDSDETLPDLDGFPTIALGSATLKMELALSQSEQRTGLMRRKGIDEDHGMLFVYQRPTRMSYWMKNVDFPIDIGFFTEDGILREVYPMYAHDTESRRSLRDDLFYALEVKYGWYKRHGIKPGAQLDLEATHEAIVRKKSNR